MNDEFFMTYIVAGSLASLLAALTSPLSAAIAIVTGAFVSYLILYWKDKYL